MSSVNPPFENGETLDLASPAAPPVAPSRLERRRDPGSPTERALALYRTIFLNSTEAIAILDTDGHYLEQNAAHARLIGYSDEELRGRTPALHLGDAVFDEIVAALEANGVCSRECTSRTRDGRTITVALATFALRDADGVPVCYVGTKRDVTDGKRAAAELHRNLAEMQAVYRMADLVNRAVALDDIYALALDELQRTVGANRAAVLLYDDAQVMRFRATRGLSDEYCRAVEGHSPWAPDEPAPQAVLVPDVLADADLAPLHDVLTREGIRAVGFIPLVDAGRLLGKFMIYFDAPHVVAPGEVRVAESLARHIAFAISRARSEAALRDSENRYRQLVEQSPVAVAVHAGGKVVFVNSAGAKLLGASDPSAVVGRPVLDFIHPESKSTVVARLAQLANGDAMLPTLEEKFVRVDGSPIDVQVSAMAFTYEGRPAAQVVVTDLTERKRAEQAQRVLAEAGALLNSSLDYQATLRAITQLAVPAVADWCMVDLVFEDGGCQRIAAEAADPAHKAAAAALIRRFPPHPEGLGVTHVMQSGEVDFVPDLDDALLRRLARDESHLAALRAAELTSYVSTPMMARGRIVGVITFGTARSGRRFTEADVPLAKELAYRAALAVDNARLYREAQEANHAKSRFLTTMSHELRTPLNAIAGYTELLQLGLRGPVTDAQLEDLTRIQRSQKHLLTLINDLLSFARIESGHLELHVEDVTIGDVLEGVHALIDPQIQASGLRFTQEHGDLGMRCRADRDRVQQILLNLLSNAVKFTPANGSITLDWSRTAGVVQLRVADTGPGIPANKLETIFQPFVQLTDALTRVNEGTGLGLAISRELARAMGGELRAISELGRGATFVLTLPGA